MSLTVNETFSSELKEEYIVELNIKKIKFVLENGADVDSMLSEEGSTALHRSGLLLCEADCVIVAQILLAYGANPNLQNKAGESSLHVAASMGYCMFLDLLLVNGGNPLLGDIKGRSPIDFAFHHNHMEAFHLLNELLDSENYDCPTVHSNNIILSFWKRAIVEVVGVPELQNLNSQEFNKNLACHIENKEEDEERELLLQLLNFSEEFNKECCCKDSSPDNTWDMVCNCANQQVKRTKDIETDTVGRKCDVGISVPNMNSKSYFNYLRQELGNNTDNESDADLLALQKCLMKNLQDCSQTDCSASLENVDSLLECSNNEFDIAQLTINTTQDGNCDASFAFDGSYVPPYKNSASKICGDAECISSFLLRNANAKICFNGLDEPVNGDSQDTSQNMSKNREVCTFHDPKSVSKEILQELYKGIDNVDANITAPQNLTKPECCTSFQLLKAPKKRAHVGKYAKKTSNHANNSNSSTICDALETELNNTESFDTNSLLISKSSAHGSLLELHASGIDVSANDTAPQNLTKPECCTSFYLLRAPKKRLHNEMSAENVDIKNPKENANLNGHHKTNPKENADLNGHYKSSRCLIPKQNCEMVNKISPLKSLDPGNTNGLQSSSEYGTAKSSNSKGSSCQTLLSEVEEFLYKDLEAGITLIERRCPTSSSITSLIGTGSRMSTLIKTLTSQKPVLGNSEDVPDSAKADQSFDSVGTLTESVKGMEGDHLRKCLMNLGFTPGPILPTTRRVYQRHFIRLRKNPELLRINQNENPIYSRELISAMEDPSSVASQTWTYLEQTMSSPFNKPDPLRHWRDGTNKTCFNYLLLDPRITQDLPVRGVMMEEGERLKCFISAILYIGKGSRNRPYYHLYEAIKSKENGSKKKSDKVKRIKDIWSDGVGVVSLHVFQNTIPVEAWTREAAMISAIGLQNLCNNIQGTFYGLTSTWSNTDRRRLGTHLLQRALKIFMQEGERQLRPSDISLPSWMKV